MPSDCRSDTLLAAGLLFLIFSSPAETAETLQRPNFVVVLADDLGYGDLACYGHPTIRTPHLDHFAQQGMRLTSYYAPSANCSPSRAGLMTGRTPYRAGIHDWIPFLSPMHLRPEETTVAELLRDAGYATCHVGKWHLNGWFNLPGQPQPDAHGFQHWFSTQNNALPNHRDPYNFVRNSIPVGPQTGYSSEIVANEAIRWLRNDRPAKQPFFLFVCFHEPHEPIATAPQHTDLYPYPDDPSRSAYYGNVTQMDTAFGRLMTALDELDLNSSTLVLFTSDNGPARTKYHNVGSAGPLREFKGHLYEGGIRVPAIVRWPQHVPVVVNDTPVCGVDFLPTVCELAGLDLPVDRKLDGTSLAPLFAGQSFQRNSPLYWQYNWAASGPRVALRHGKWKLLASLDPVPTTRTDITDESNRVLKSAKPAHFELYDLAEDLGETINLAAREPAVLAELTQLLQQTYDEVQAETPVWPAWTFPRYEAQRIVWPNYTVQPR